MQPVTGRMGGRPRSDRFKAIAASPRSPWENDYAESFHSRVRDEFLALEVFESLPPARTLTAAWKEDYDHRRPRVIGLPDPRGPLESYPQPTPS